jgi:uncharacterized membrane protein YgcG
MKIQPSVALIYIRIRNQKVLDSNPGWILIFFSLSTNLISVLPALLLSHLISQCENVFILDFLERMASPMNPDNFFLGNKRRSLMICELGKLPSCTVNEEMEENGLQSPGAEGGVASGGVVAGGGGEGAGGGGRMRGSVGSEAVDRALVQHLIHCECLLQVSWK